MGNIHAAAGAMDVNAEMGEVAGKGKAEGGAADMGEAHEVMV